MSKEQSRNFRAEAKTKIVLEMLEEELTIAQLLAKYEVVSKPLGTNNITHKYVEG